MEEYLCLCYIPRIFVNLLYICRIWLHLWDIYIRTYRRLGVWLSPR